MAEWTGEGETIGEGDWTLTRVVGAEVGTLTEMVDGLEAGSLMGSIEAAGMVAEEVADSVGGLDTWAWLLGVAVVVVPTVLEVEVSTSLEVEADEEPLTKYFSSIGR